MQCTHPPEELIFRSDTELGLSHLGKVRSAIFQLKKQKSAALEFPFVENISFELLLVRFDISSLY
jgi:hypothetical protein